ncbi:Protein CBG19201 [Caenorhabditis briggsae]|uniref:CX domain-containing protein n=2 Tax=Caenorhabditis briggsae TaxID=6238 RepID=A0AAE9D1L8_CAEBR|nr:Protein CBG19201 [Caenorhabditis briggsae]ULT90673.1 hypothetical protein L3Y34_008773 [Caenorhabditis briggsae]CAP36492.1 Protein CBG19201 [Caenorhabditis briggsae]
MKVRLCFIFLCLLLLFSLFDETSARGGGGRGGRGRGRGRSGARGGGGSRGKSTMRSGIRGSSSYSGGYRQGAYGYKTQSSTSSFSNFGSSSFRNQHFYHNPNIQVRAGHPFVILAATQPMFYDNRNYYWSYSLTKSATSNETRPESICEYVFGEDDGDLRNMTFANGTQVKSIFFSCTGTVDCCGMYCCHDFGQWFELLFVIGFIAVIIFIAYHAKRSEMAKGSSSKDLEPLRPVKAKGKTGK